MIQKKVRTFPTKKDVKITKRAHAFKDYASPYDVETLNSFNLELQLKNKLIELLTQLTGFTFVRSLVWVFKKIESEDRRKYIFYWTSKAEIIINEKDIHDVFLSIYLDYNYIKH